MRPARTRLDDPMHLLLFQRDDCKLCDEAAALLARAHVPDFESVWIDGEAELEARYGERVPVLHDEDSGRELGWPFDGQGLRVFLAEATGSRPSTG